MNRRGLSMFYQAYEMNQTMWAPMRAAAKAGLAFWSNESNPLSRTAFGRSQNASLEIMERLTRRYSKPEFGLRNTIVSGQTISIAENVILQKPFASLIHFKKVGYSDYQQKLLIVAPMSGHNATLLRGTVEGMLPHYDVYITDWIDARQVPLTSGSFDLDDYTDYIIDFLHQIGEPAHVMAVCQPSVPVMAAVTLMSQRDDTMVPKSMVLMGGPIDTRSSPTAVNKVAEGKSLDWFKNNVVMQVPMNFAGAGRAVYPGFMQLAGFIGMNFDKHAEAHRELFWDVYEGDETSVDKHKKFYDEYFSVMDLTAEFYLQTIDRVFIHADLPEGTYRYRGKLLEPKYITKTGLLTIEGENDDISGIGQTEAAHKICTGINEANKAHYLQLGVGHYGVFSGSRFRKEVVPVITNFCNAVNVAT